jgi:hypothetical protein
MYGCPITGWKGGYNYFNRYYFAQQDKPVLFSMSVLMEEVLLPTICGLYSIANCGGYFNNVSGDRRPWTGTAYRYTRSEGYDCK